MCTIFLFFVFLYIYSNLNMKTLFFMIFLYLKMDNLWYCKWIEGRRCWDVDFELFRVIYFSFMDGNIDAIIFYWRHTSLQWGLIAFFAFIFKRFFVKYTQHIFITLCMCHSDFLVILSKIDLFLSMKPCPTFWIILNFRLPNNILGLWRWC